MGTTDTYSGGVNCHNSTNGKPKQMFIGSMAYLRAWFHQDIYAITIGGGLMNNPGRYLTLLPPIDGATPSAAPRTLPRIRVTAHRCTTAQ